MPGAKAASALRASEFVNDSEIGERLIGCPEAQRIAQPVTWCGRRCGIRTAREIRDGLLEEVTRERHRHGVGVLVVQDAGRTVGQCSRVGHAVCDCCCRH